MEEARVQVTLRDSGRLSLILPLSRPLALLRFPVAGAETALKRARNRKRRNKTEASTESYNYRGGKQVPTLVILLLLAMPSPALEGGLSEVSANGMVDIGNGQLYYEIDGSGPTVVLLHGGMLDLRMWDSQVKPLTQHFRVLRYDARGHGRSDPIEGEHSHYDDLFRLMNTLEIEKAAIVGLSLGGRTAIDFALEHPDRVSALVPVAPGLSGWKFGRDPVLVKHWQGMQEAAQDGEFSDADYVEWFQKSWTDGPKRKPDEVPADVREKVRMMALATAEKPRQSGEYVEANAVNRLNEIRAPTLAIVGDLDMQDIIDIAKLVETEVENAQMVTIPGVAHMVNMEAPDEFNRRLLVFLKNLDLP
jgi:pimeloyl-ACP methyl ester carboxylesterase